MLSTSAVALSAVSLFEATISAIETRDAVSDWPADLDDLAEGELWVSSDLMAFAHSRGDWIPDYRGALRPGYGRDVTSVDTEPLPRLRTYRQLDADWYAWLFRATVRARATLETADPAAWARQRQRANALWSVARRWWPRQLVQLQRGDLVSAVYQPPVPDPAVAARFRAAKAAEGGAPRTPSEGAGHANPGSIMGPPGAAEREGEAGPHLSNFWGKKL